MATATRKQAMAEPKATHKPKVKSVKKPSKKFASIKTHPFGVFDGFGAPPYLVVERRDKPRGVPRGFASNTDELQKVFRTWEAAKKWAIAEMESRQQDEAIDNGIALLEEAETYEQYNDWEAWNY